jgi:DNA-binding transcriptional LysR family regulator
MPNPQCEAPGRPTRIDYSLNATGVTSVAMHSLGIDAGRWTRRGLMTPVLEDLMAFVAVVDAGGFNAAGVAVGASGSQLSRRVAALERFLGVTLLVRNSRRFSVTDMGWRTYEHGASIRARLHDAVADARDSLGEPSGALRVACPMALGAAIVGPLAIRFTQQHPRVRMTIESTDGRLRPGSDGVDLIIQPTLVDLRDSSLIARKLVDVRYMLVAAPLLRQQVPPILPASSSETLPAPIPPPFPAIGWTFLPQASRWSLTHPELGGVELDVDVRFATDSLLLVREAALAGMGVAQLPQALCAADIEAGRLVVIAPGWSPPSVTFYAIYPSRRALTLAARRFLETLTEALAPLDPAAT